jgi:hypothetical protein
LLPIGLAKGARLIRPVPVDTPITTRDVEMKPSTILDLRSLQDAWYRGVYSEAELLRAVDGLANEPFQNGRQPEALLVG